jgi:predicted O-methyltransferase YrrM
MNISLPQVITDTINKFYDDYLKTDKDGNQRDMRLGSGCPRREECFVLANLYLKEKPQNSLDFGLGEGTACLALTATRKYLGLEGKHITLDPFQFTLAKGIGVNEIKKYQLEDYVDFLEEKSEEFLYDEYQKNKQYQFVFVDGAHDIGHKVVDAFWIDQILSKGGLIVFHDSLFFSTSVAIRYLVEQQGYEILNVNVDPAWKAWGRALRHTPRLGANYCLKYIPNMGKAVTALRKP